MVSVKVFDNPEQPSKLGVTLMVATIGFVPLFTAVNAGISPAPLAPIPIVGLSLVQL